MLDTNKSHLSLLNPNLPILNHQIHWICLNHRWKQGWFPFNALCNPNIETSLNWTCNKPYLILLSYFSKSNLIQIYFDIIFISYNSNVYEKNMLQAYKFYTQQRIPRIQGMTYGSQQTYLSTESFLSKTFPRHYVLPIHI